MNLKYHFQPPISSTQEKTSPGLPKTNRMIELFSCGEEFKKIQGIVKNT
jgi:hypothetical protein